MPTLPSGQKHYLVVEDFGVDGRAYTETDLDDAAIDDVVARLMYGEHARPVQIIEIDPEAGDVTARILKEAVERAWLDGVTLVPGVRRLAEEHGIVVPAIEKRAA